MECLTLDPEILLDLSRKTVFQLRLEYHISGSMLGSGNLTISNPFFMTITRWCDGPTMSDVPHQRLN